MVLLCQSDSAQELINDYRTFIMSCYQSQQNASFAIVIKEWYENQKYIQSLFLQSIQIFISQLSSFKINLIMIFVAFKQILLNKYCVQHMLLQNR